MNSFGEYVICFSIICFWWKILMFEYNLKKKINSTKKIMTDATGFLNEKEFINFKKALIKSEKEKFRKDHFSFK